MPQGSILGPLLFLIYVNDLTENLKCSVKLIADDTLFFTVVHDPNLAARDINHDLDQIALWSHNWRMSFNPDPLKQAVELVFSKKKVNTNHPAILFNASPVSTVDQHKYLRIILDSKLSFSSRIQAAINKARKAIGMLKFMSKYLPRNTQNDLYKLYVRPHQDYGDVFYHLPQREDGSENCMMSRLESVHYFTALAVTGAWKGTSRDRLYKELGWESLNSRKMK